MPFTLAPRFRTAPDLMDVVDLRILEKTKAVDDRIRIWKMALEKGLTHT